MKPIGKPPRAVVVGNDGKVHTVSGIINGRPGMSWDFDDVLIPDELFCVKSKKHPLILRCPGFHQAYLHPAFMQALSKTKEHPQADFPQCFAHSFVDLDDDVSYLAYSVLTTGKAQPFEIKVHVCRCTLTVNMQLL